MRWIMLVLAASMIFWACAPSTEVSYRVDLSYTPDTVYAGDLVGVQVNVVPKPLVQLNTSVSLMVNGKIYTGDRVPFIQNLRLKEGVYTIKASYVYGGEIFESSPITLEVKPLNEKYSVVINAPGNVDLGSDVDVSVQINPVPDMEGWYTEIYIDNVKSAIINPSEFTDGSFVYVWKSPEAGRHTIKAILKTPYGEVQSPQKKVLVVDPSPPVIDSFRIIPSIPTTGRPIYAYVQFTEDESDVEKIEAYIDGVLSGTSIPLGNFSFVKIADSLNYGEYNLSIAVTNSSGNSSVYSTTLRVIPSDVVPPRVEISTRKGVYSSYEGVTVDISMSDNSAVSGYEVRVDGAVFRTVQLSQPKHTYEVSEYLGSFNEGLHIITVMASDLSGNTSQDETYFYVSNSIVNVRLFMEPSNPQVGDRVTFYVSFPEGAEISELEFLVDSVPIYSYPSSDTEFRTYAIWTTRPGHHKATVFVKTVDNKYGMDSIQFSVQDIGPPAVEEVRVNGTVLGTDPYVPVVVPPGQHTIRVKVVDDSALPVGNTIEMDVYDIDGEERLIQTLALEQEEISPNHTEAIYSITVNLPIGTYALVPKNIPDEEGNVLTSAGRYYVRVKY